MTPKEIRNERLAQKMIKNLERRNMEACYCATTAEAIERVMGMMPSGSSISWGGSMTIRDMGLTAALHYAGCYDLIDRDLAKDRDIVLMSTKQPMFASCGMLYEKGLRGGAPV